MLFISDTLPSPVIAYFSYCHYYKLFNKITYIYIVKKVYNFISIDNI